MKRLTVLSIFVMVALTISCQDHTFKVPVMFEQGFYFADSTFMNTASSGSGSVSWDAITGKPATYPPSSHNHDAFYKAIGYVPAWAEITGKPSTFPPSTHNHDALYRPITWSPAWNDITGKPTEIELGDELPKLNGWKICQKTTAEINAMVIPVDEVVEVWDKTLGVKKVCVKGVWKTYITNQ